MPRMIRWMLGGWLFGASAALALANAAELLPGDDEPLLRLLKARDFEALAASMDSVQAAYEAGGEEAALASTVWLFRLPSVATEDVDAWAKAHPDRHAARLAAGAHYLQLAFWTYVDPFTDQTSVFRRKVMSAHLETARGHLTAALYRTRKPVIALKLLIDLARNDASRSVQDHYLQKAVELAPTTYEARASYLWGLQPRWGGSHAQMRAFVDAAGATGLDARGQQRLKALRLRIEGEDAERSGNPQKAVELLTEAIGAYDRDNNAFTSRGRVLRQLGRKEEAWRDLHQAISINRYDYYAYNNLSQMLDERGRTAESLHRLRQAAAAGNGHSATRLGGLLYQGTDKVAADRKEALHWLLLASRMGSAWAMGYVADAYLDGIPGVLKKDKAEALRWLLRSRDYGDVIAASNAGSLYWNGPPGVERDPLRAVELWIEGLRSGDPTARQHALSNLSRLLNPVDLASAFAKASGFPRIATGMFVVMAVLPLLSILVAATLGSLAARWQKEHPGGLVFMPTRRSWLTTALATPAVGLIALAVFFWPQLQVQFVWALSMTLAAAFFAAQRIAHVVRGEGVVRILPGELRYRAQGRPEKVPWAGIAFARKEPGCIVIGTGDDRVHVIADESLDRGLWDEIRRRVPAHALRPDAHKRMRKAASLFAHQRPLPPGQQLAARPSWLLNAILWGGLIFFGALFGATTVFGQTEQWAPAAYYFATGVFLLFFLLSALALLTSGTVRLSSDSVEYRNRFGTYRLAWAEVERIEVDPYRAAVVLRGKGKQLVMIGPAYWGGEEASRSAAFLYQVAEQLGIPVTQSALASFRLSKGCKAPLTAGKRAG